MTTTVAGPMNQIGVQNELTVSTAAVSLTLPTGLRPNHALIHVGGADIRWTADDTTPTTSVGMPVAAGSYIDWTDPNIDYRSMIARVQFIRDGGTDATLNVAFFD